MISARGNLVPERTFYNSEASCPRLVTVKKAEIMLAYSYRAV